jgi:hypothetical protein
LMSLFASLSSDHVSLKKKRNGNGVLLAWKRENKGWSVLLIFHEIYLLKYPTISICARVEHRWFKIWVELVVRWRKVKGMSLVRREREGRIMGSLLDASRGSSIVFIYLFISSSKINTIFFIHLSHLIHLTLKLLTNCLFVISALHLNLGYLIGNMLILLEISNLPLLILWIY